MMSCQSQKTGEPRLTRQQQVELVSGKPMADVLTEPQKRHMQWRKKVKGEVSAETDTPSFYLFAVNDDGRLTYQFKVKTLSPKWYVHVYVHSTWEHFKKHHKTRSDRMISGAMFCKVNSLKTGGLLADIHFLADGLSELTVIHESVHAAAYLTRILSDQEAKELAVPYLYGDRHNLMRCKEEIQCRTVEFLTKCVF